MAHLSSSSLWAEIAADAAKAYAAGIHFFVVVENGGGEWFALHADDQAHAAALAHHWVDALGCRGASCWRLFSFGPAPEAFYSYFEPFGDEIEDVEPELALDGKWKVAGAAGAGASQGYLVTAVANGAAKIYYGNGGKNV